MNLYPDPTTNKCIDKAYTDIPRDTGKAKSGHPGPNDITIDGWVLGTEMSILWISIYK